MKNRIIWIDTLKCIGIFFVVLAHNTVSQKNMDNLSNWIYSFHMPLFFFISGFLFNPEKYGGLKNIIMRKARTLLVPYFIFSLITYLFWIFILRRFGEASKLDITWWKPLVGTLYGNGFDNWLAHNTVLWFLVCLFVIEISFFILSRIENRINLAIALILCGLIGALDSLYMPIRLPWGIDIALTGMVFYGIGFLIQNKLEKLIEKRIITGISLILFGVISIILSHLNGRIDMNGNNYGNFFYFYAASLSGILTLICLSKLIGYNRIMCYIGENTIIILVLHNISHSIINGILKFALHIPVKSYEHMLGYLIGITLLQIALIVPAIYIINHFMPFLIGRKKELAT